MCLKPKENQSVTQRNWLALRRIALCHMRHLRSTHPQWACEDLISALEMPRTALLLELAVSAGFTSRSCLSAEEVLAVTRTQGQGVCSHQVIALETGIPIERVRMILERQGAGYGGTPYGKTPYGRNRQYADGGAEVARRITVNGQMSYRGRMYNLGTAYRGRLAMVREDGRRLAVIIADQPPIFLAR
jgi:hypothetical protein